MSEPQVMRPKHYLEVPTQGHMGNTSSADQSNDCPDGAAGEDGTCGPVAKTTRTHLICLSRAHNKFAVQLYQEFAKDGKRPGNFMYSPLCLGLGLGLVYLGAQGNSRDELHKALHLNEVQESQLLPAFAAMHWDLMKTTMPKGYVMEVAIRLCVQAGGRMTPQYEEICSNYELTRMRPVDFEQRPDLARREINKWVEDKTAGRIKDFLPLGIIDRQTRLFIITAIYIKAQFLHQFDHRKTDKGVFYLAMKETLDVEMMNQQNNFRVAHISKLDCEVLELPFGNGHVKMYILLPRKQDGLAKVEAKLTRTLLEALEDLLTEEYVDVFLPKFKYELGYTTADIVQKLGVRDIFTPGKANLSNLTDQRDLFISKMFNHVFMEVDESGHETSSVTSVHEVGAADNKPKKVFKADHPFLFYLRDDRTGAVIFMGRCVRPIYPKNKC